MSLPISTVSNYIFNTTANDFRALLNCSLYCEQSKIQVENQLDHIPFSFAESKETTVYGRYENFRLPSIHRQCLIVVTESYDKQMDFYVNLDDMNVLAPGLVWELGRFCSYPDGTNCGIGEIGAGIVEFQTLLTLLCNCCGETKKKEIIGQNMFGILVLSGRYGIRSLIAECRQYVLNADYSKLSYETVRSWFDGFIKNSLDDQNETMFNLLSPKLMLKLGNGARKTMRENSPNNIQSIKIPDYANAQTALIQFYTANTVTASERKR